MAWTVSIVQTDKGVYEVTDLKTGNFVVADTLESAIAQLPEGEEGDMVLSVPVTAMKMDFVLMLKKIGIGVAAVTVLAGVSMIDDLHSTAIPLIKAVLYAMTAVVVTDAFGFTNFKKFLSKFRVS